MDFFIILKRSVFFLLIKLQEEFPLSNIFAEHILQIKIALKTIKFNCSAILGSKFQNQAKISLGAPDFWIF